MTGVDDGIDAVSGEWHLSHFVRKIRSIPYLPENKKQGGMCGELMGVFYREQERDTQSG